MSDAAKSLIDDPNFVEDLSRYAEGILTEEQIKKKYHFDDATWARLGEDEKLIEAIEAEKTRRIRSGITARERAQRLFAETPAVLGDILHGETVSPRHKIESARELRAIAATGPENRPAADRFIITIDLSGDRKLDKPDPSDVIIIDATPQKAPPAVTDKSKDDREW